MPEPPPPLPPSLTRVGQPDGAPGGRGPGRDHARASPRRSPATARTGSRWSSARRPSGLGRTEDAYHELKRTGALPPDYELHRQHSFGAMMEALRRVAGIRRPLLRRVDRLLGQREGRRLRAAPAGHGRRRRRAGRRRRRAVADHAARLPQPPDPEPRVLPAAQRASGGASTSARAPPTCCSNATATRRARLLGVGESSDAHHMSAPDPDRRRRARGDGAAALAQADLPPGDVDYINAHSPGTRLNDLSEGLRDHGAVRRARPGRVDQGLHGPPAGRGRRDRGGLRDRRHRAGLDPAQRRRRPGRRRLWA